MSSSQNKQAGDVSSAVRQIVTEMSPAGVVDELDPESKLVADLGFDSLGLVELLVVVEDSLDLPPIDETALAGMECVADLERVVQEAHARIPSN